VGISYRTDDAGCAVSVWDGEITTDVVRAHMAAVEADRRWVEAGCYVTDLRTVSAASAPSPVDVLAVADAFREQLSLSMRGRRWAIVAGDLVEHLTQFKRRVDEHDVVMMPFGTLEAACHWTGGDYEVIRQSIHELRAEIRNREV
jgi:hypothetical protein